MVKRIFESRYGKIEPIKIHRSDIVYHFLQGDPVRVQKNHYRKLQNELSETVMLDVSTTLYRRLRARQRQVTIGYYLHKVFQEDLLSFVEAQVLAGIPAQTAMKTYLNRHNISEDDYGLDTAYTAWKRRKTFFAKKYPENIANTQQCTDLCFLDENDHLVRIPNDPRDVINAVNEYYQCGIVHLLCRNIQVKSKRKSFTYIYDNARHYEFLREKKVLAYLLYVDSRLTGTDISKIMKLDWSTIYKYIASVKTDYELYDDIKNEVDSIRALIERTT